LIKLKELHDAKKMPLHHAGIIVLAPTRELAQQTHVVTQQLCRLANLRSVCLYGGAPRHGQIREMRYGADIIIATPGRLNDFIEARIVDLKKVMFAVLDEADRMLDMGFEPQISGILASLPPHQTVMFSATWPREVRNLAAKYQNNPIKVSIGSPDVAKNKNIKQIVKVIDSSSKSAVFTQLIKDIFKDQCRILVFTNTKAFCARNAQTLWDAGLPSNAIHGDMEQGARNRALSTFRDGTFPILFATDVAARGLDIKGVEYVVNLDMPDHFDNYIHRIGRTGRAGHTGIAYTLFTHDDYNASQLVNLLKDCEQEVPMDLLQLSARHNKSGSFGGRRPNFRNRFGQRRSSDRGMDDKVRGWGNKSGGRGAERSLFPRSFAGGRGRY